jgi:hypothetical protein
MGSSEDNKATRKSIRRQTEKSVCRSMPHLKYLRLIEH